MFKFFILELLQMDVTWGKKLLGKVMFFFFLAWGVFKKRL